MTRLATTFERCRAEGRAALIGYLTGFDPDRDASLQRMIAACDAGLDVLELGVPFSDPNADGPEVQGAMVRALQAGATVAGMLELAAALRKAKPGLPIVLFSYANPLLAYGPARLAEDAAAAGIDALLVVDVPAEHAEVLRSPVVRAGLDWIGLVAPTTPPARQQRILQATSGFVYAVTLRGVTGAALDTERPELERQLSGIRAQTSLPIAAGFGVRTPEQARSIARHADGVVVGSALIAAARQDGPALATFVRAFRDALGGAP